MMKLYVVLTFTGTLLSKFVRYHSENDYAHCSISFNKEATDMYSFGRKYTYSPLIGALVKEDINKGLFKVKDNALLCILEVDVSKKEYKAVRKTVKRMYENKEAYKYNLYGFVNYAKNKTVVLDDKFTCSQFVAYVLYENGILDIKDPSLFKPCDFLNKNLKIVYEGTVSDYLKISECTL